MRILEDKEAKKLKKIVIKEETEIDDIILKKGDIIYVKEKKLKEARLNVDKILNSYLTTALWASVDDNDEPLDYNYDSRDIAKETIQKSKKDINLFIRKTEKLLDSSNLDEEAIGHNFWLTRNRHGAGFWDLGLGKLGDDISKIAESFGEVNMYVSNDNIYID
jgi:hypothetical protein